MGYILLSAFTKLGQDALSIYSNNVASLMAADTQFAPFSKEITELTTCNTHYTTALANNVNGGRPATIEKDNCNTAVKEQLKKVATLVDLYAKGDESIILAAGFSMRKSPNSYKELDAPDVLKLVNETKTGVITVQLSKVTGATNYGIQKRIKVSGVETAWMNGEYSSALKFQLADLESAKEYQLQFRAIGNKGLVSPWSSVVEVLVS